MIVIPSHNIHCKDKNVPVCLCQNAGRFSPNPSFTAGFQLLQPRSLLALFALKNGWVIPGRRLNFQGIVGRSRSVARIGSHLKRKRRSTI